MKKITHVLCVVFICFLFLSCEYESSEDYYNDIELQEPSVNLTLSALSDGEVLRESKIIHYNYSAPDKNSLYEIQFYVDDSFLESSELNSGSVLLDIENINEGDHTFRVKYYFKTSSGSLAEISGTESYFIIEEFNFSVIKNISPVEIDRIENKEGTLYIYFKNYDQIDEINESINVDLVVNTNSYSNETFFGSSKTIELTKEDIRLGYYVDRESTGLMTRYKTLTSNDFNSLEDEKEINLLDDFEFSVTPIDFENLKIKWNNHPLYNNVSTISFHPDIYDDRSSVYLSDGEAGELIVETETFIGSRNDFLIDFGQRIISSYPYGEKINGINFNKLKYNPSTDKIYALEIIENENNYYENEIFIHVLNSSNLAVEKSSFIANTIGNYGEISISKESKIIIDLNRKSILINELNLNIINTYEGSDYHSDIVNYTKVGFRDDIIIINNSYDTYTYDINSKELILSNNNSYYAFVSQNAKYIALENKIYYKNESANSYELFHEFSFNSSSIDNMIYIEEENIFYVTINTSYNRGLVYSLDSITREETRVYFPSVTYISYIDYDYSTNKLLLKDQSGYKIRSYNIETEEMNVFEYFGSGRFLINDFLISSEGYYLKDVL